MATGLVISAMALRFRSAQNRTTVSSETQDDGPIVHNRKPLGLARLARNPVVTLSAAGVIAAGDGAALAAKAASGSSPRSSVRVERVDPQRQDRALASPPDGTKVVLADTYNAPAWRTNCGYATCSIYYSRATTQQIAESLIPDRELIDGGASIGFTTACEEASGAVEGVDLRLAYAACGIAGLASAINFFDTLQQAYKGYDCFEIKYLPAGSFFQQDQTSQWGYPDGIPVDVEVIDQSSFCG